MRVFPLTSFIIAWCTPEAAGRFDRLDSKEEKGQKLKHKLNIHIICLLKEGFAVCYSTLLNE